MKKILNWIKNHILFTIGAFVVLIIIIFISIYLFRSSHGGIYGNRCKDHDKYEISASTNKKVKKRINEIDEVNSVDIYTKLCTIKIIVSLKKDVDIDKIKTMSKDILSYFSSKELRYYDFSLYVTSDNEESEIYPINVSRHKTSENFAW